MLFLANLLNSNPHLDRMLPCSCPAAGGASRENPTGIRDSELGEREEGIPCAQVCTSLALLGHPELAPQRVAPKPEATMLRDRLLPSPGPLLVSLFSARRNTNF